MPLRFRPLAIASVSLTLLAATAGYFFAGHAAPTASPASQGHRGSLGEEAVTFRGLQTDSGRVRQNPAHVAQETAR